MIEEINEHIISQTNLINQQLTNNHWLTAVLQLHNNCYDSIVQTIKDNKINNPRYKWVIYSMKKHKKILFVGIFNLKEIEMMKKNRNIDKINFEG